MFGKWPLLSIEQVILSMGGVIFNLIIVLSSFLLLPPFSFPISFSASPSSPPSPPAENSTRVCTNGDIRLVGSQAPYEGLVEVCFSGHWGTVCHDNWDSQDAQVVCRLLGYDSGPAIPTRSNFFGVVDFSRPVLLDEVECNGTETGFLQCLSVDPGDHDCSHSLDAGVFCSGECTGRPGLTREGTGRPEVLPAGVAGSHP